MCLARPVKIIKRDGEWAEVENNGAGRVYLGLILNKGVSAGDYLLVHGDLAINKLPEDEAKRIIGLVDELDTQ